MSKKNNNASPVAKILNHYVVKNVLILMFAGFFIYYGTLVFLKRYTHHGEALQVPDVTGLTLEEAGNVLRAQKMRWQLSDSVYVNTAMPGAVVNQNPEPGSKVKENRNIFLIVNAIAPERVRMPDVVGVSFRQAKSMLESHGLNVGRTDYVHDIARDYVLRQQFRGQEIRRGTEVLKGSNIDLVLGRGLSDERTPVPDLLGSTLLAARSTLTQHSLNFGVIDYDQTVVTSADSIRAFIYRQRPIAGANNTLQLGSSVDVWASVDETKKPETIQE